VVYHQASVLSCGFSIRRCVRISHENPPSTQSPFARSGGYPSRHGIAYRVSGHYPTFIAHTDSCARPKGSYRLRSPLFRQVFAGCRHSLLPDGPSRRYLCESFTTCKDPYPGGSCGALTRFFPQDIGLPREISRSAFPRNPCFSNFSMGRFSRLQSFVYLQARRFARHPGCSYRSTSQRWAAVAFTSPPISVRCLPEQGIC